jgi:hypothetical protein
MIGVLLQDNGNLKDRSYESLHVGIHILRDR